MKNFKKVILLFIPLITSLIIFSWFHEGKIISSTSEEELSIYHSQNTARGYSTLWYSGGTGLVTPFLISRFPVFYTLGLMEQAGLKVVLNQAILLWILMVAGIAGMYLLLKYSFKLNTFYSFVGSIFYLLNIFSMTQVWKRFLYHGIFAWAYLPIFLALWIKWIESRKIVWLGIFVFTSVFFSEAFAQPAFLITVWVPAFIFIVTQFWTKKFSKNQLLSLIYTSSIGLIFWCLINIWWLYPTLTIGSSWTERSGQNWQSDLVSLQGVSKSFPFWEVLLLRQSWYLSSTNDFGSYYQNPIIYIISILIFCIVIVGIFNLRSLPFKSYILVLGLISFFISKGTNFPLGYPFFYLLFSYLSFSEAFRNSYEKFGIVWLLVYTILFVMGLSKLILFFNPNKRIFIFFSIAVLILILMFPFWNGGVFPKKHRISVPAYYDLANNYLNKHSSGRLFHIPYSLELGNSKYSWGFEGGDPSVALFDLDSITKAKMPHFYKLTVEFPKLENHQNFPKILGWLGVSNIILHKDIMYPKIDLPETIKKIENWKGIFNKKEIGELIIYSLDKKLINQRIYVANTIIPVQSTEEGLTKILSDNFNTRTAVFVLNDQQLSFSSTLNLPKIDFKKITNEHYLVDIKQATSPYILVLGNTFDKLWQVKIDKKLANKHFIVNGFANGWLVEKTGNYIIDIRLKVWPWD